MALADEFLNMQSKIYAFVMTWELGPVYSQRYEL
jgi:hypothetical protein